MVFAFGCDDSLQTTSGDYNVTNINTPWSKALRIIQGALADNDPLVRVHAIEVVASTRQLKLMPQVHRLLQDKFVPVRFAAALAVGDSECDPFSQRLLRDEFGPQIELVAVLAENDGRQLDLGAKLDAAARADCLVALIASDGAIPNRL